MAIALSGKYTAPMLFSPCDFNEYQSQDNLSRHEADQLPRRLETASPKLTK
jgi:hypothetical protein